MLSGDIWAVGVSASQGKACAPREEVNGSTTKQQHRPARSVKTQRGNPWVSLGPAWEVASCSSQRDHMVSSEKHNSLSSRECGFSGRFLEKSPPPPCLSVL